MKKCNPHSCGFLEAKNKTLMNSIPLLVENYLTKEKWLKLIVKAVIFNPIL